MLAGTLARGGAEKQFVYMARALQASGADVRVFALTRGELHEEALAQLGLRPKWIGRHGNPMLRAMALAAAIRGWRPHVVQAGHFYVNLHVTFAAVATGALSLGTMRSDGARDVRSTGALGRASLLAPRGLITNSHAARSNAESLGRSTDRVLVVPNVIDLAAFDRERSRSAGPRTGVGFAATMVARLVPPKRIDRFVRALASARSVAPDIRGRIVGEGPERAALERLAAGLGLLPEGLQFAGDCSDVPAQLLSADALVLTSDQEGFPNVLLEGMAAGLPVVTTPAGDAERIVVHEETGFIVGMDDVEALSARLVALARAPAVCARMGAAGRVRVEQEFSDRTLAASLRSAYAAAQSWAPRRAQSGLG